MTPAEAKQLSARLGAGTFERRLRREGYRKGTREMPVSGLRRVARLMVVHKLRLLGPFIRFAFRATGLWGVARRNYLDVRVTEREQPLEGLPAGFDGYRVLHLSDLHLDLDTALTDRLLKVLDGVRADLCVITGDYRNFTIGETEPAVAEFRRLKTVLPMPVYGVMGNHDSLEQVLPMEAAGLRMLLNEREVLERGGDRICLAGIDDPNVYGTHRLRHALHGIPADMFKILLSHSPAAYREASEAGVGWMLAGHLHAGQICPPWGGIYLRNDKSPRRCWVGPWREGRMEGYTSRGTGGCGVPLRMFSPPEAVVHVLRSRPANPDRPPAGP